MTTLRTAGLRAARATGVRIRGPWGLPILFAACALVGLAESLRLILTGGTPEARAGGWYLLVVSALITFGALGRPERTATATVPARKSHAREAIVFLIATAVFAWALPWVGFAIANGLFVAAYLIWVDHRRWWRAVLIAVVVDAVLVVGLKLIDVVLPGGVLGIGI